MDTATTSTSVQYLVATHCACCARTLKDAQSVERGIGPDCFRKYYDKCSAAADFVTATRMASVAGMMDRIAALLDRQDARGACNVVVQAIAAEWEHPATIDRIQTIRALGFEKLALKLEERLYGDRGLVSVYERPFGFVVTTKDLDRAMFDRFVEAVRAIPSRRWHSEVRANVVALSDRAALWNALRRALPGCKLLTEKGESTIPALKAVA